jgi:hypothetical protein
MNLFKINSNKLSYKPNIHCHFSQEYCFRVISETQGNNTNVFSCEMFQMYFIWGSHSGKQEDNCRL